jgi:hypothetical protein
MQESRGWQVVFQRSDSDTAKLASMVAPKTDNQNSANFIENFEKIIVSFESYGGFPPVDFKGRD